MKFADFSIKHPAIISILLVTLVFFGVLSFRSISQSLFPDIGLPSIIVFTAYPGVSPKDIEREVTDPLEKELSTMPGVQRIISSSRNSVSFITVEMDWNTNLDMKIGEIREKINAAMGNLPEGIQGVPMLFKMEANAMPIYSVSVLSDIDRQTLTKFAKDEIAPILSRISGVSEVNVHGAPPLIVDIKVHLNQLESKGISILDIFQVLKNNNVSLPAGSVVFQAQSLNMRTAAEFTSLAQIEQMVIGYRDTSYIRLKDVAEVSLTEKRVETEAISDGEDVIIVDVYKQPNSDTNTIITEAKKVIDTFDKDYPGVLSFKTVADQTVDIKLAINSVKSAAITGGILAVIVLLLFLLSFRTTIIIAISIPLSLLLAFIGMRLKGQSFNLMTLGGLTVAIGMIVDNSIVILENTFRHFKHGEDRMTAASIGASEVGGAVIASTTTSLCVFFPLLFIKGIAGLILGDVAYTILYALAASLIVAIFVVPFLSSRILTEEHVKEHIPVIRGITKAVERGLEGLENGYRRVLRSAIENKAFVIILAAAVLVMSVLSLNLLGFSFTQPTDMNEFTIDIEAPPRFTVKETRAKVSQVEAILKEKVPETDTTLFYIGQSGTLGIGSSPSRAYGRIRLLAREFRDRDIFAIINLLREELPSRIPDMNITVVNGGIDTYVAIATGGQGFTLELTGNNLDDVIAASSAVKDLMAQDPNVAKAEMNVSFNQQELVSYYSLDYMGNLGITPYEAAVTSRIIFNGMEAGTYRDDAGTYDIFLNSDVAGERITDDVLNRMAVRSRSGKFISFANFSTMELEPALSTINHKNKMKTIEVTGYLREANVRETSDRITSKLESLSLPIGVEWEVAGSAAEMLKSFKSLVVAMLVAAFLVYMVMVIQFERFAQPLIVMAAIPFTLIGIVGGLVAFGSTLSIIAFMGVIALFGIVVNNAIVLIDYTNLLRKQKDYDLLQAVIQGGSTRLKPILMTTLTTVLGIIPMALSRKEGAELYAPLGQAIAGGLLTSTLITLFLVPVLYYMLESAFERRGREKENGQKPGVTI